MLTKSPGNSEWMGSPGVASQDSGSPRIYLQVEMAGVQGRPTMMRVTVNLRGAVQGGLEGD